ncbi:hypothetical protein N7497_003737 [Penicillium chrysogenum]|nr:hypothetical protein N7497_003737 [Penicillium chrysogenum]
MHFFYIILQTELPPTVTPPDIFSGSRAPKRHLDQINQYTLDGSAKPNGEDTEGPAVSRVAFLVAAAKPLQSDARLKRHFDNEIGLRLQNC